MGGAAGGAEALIVDRCAHHQEVAAGETSHPALITYTNLIDSDHMGNLSPPTPGHWRYPTYMYMYYGSQVGNLQANVLAKYTEGTDLKAL